MSLSAQELAYRFKMMHKHPSLGVPELPDLWPADIAMPVDGVAPNWTTEECARIEHILENYGL